MSESEHGQIALEHIAIGCPNSACRKLTLVVTLRPAEWSGGNWSYGNAIEFWSLLPRSRAKPQPEYIPKAIRDDYTEACLILDDSPKASATMSRRCLQGIVRDYWNIPENKRGNLGAELNSIKDQVDPSTWEVIQTIRKVGDIGAHMEKDVNYVVDVELEEADLLIELIETLIDDWYIARQKRLNRDDRVKALANKKLEEKRQAKQLAKGGKPMSDGDQE
ncbi:DUF4145 domain-containing protein [Hyphomonas sp.]|uniref:DUF4145 domain-containing protein n=1 Tax=Hyphomonas sp. TaxID=87 RepID=UPI003241D1C2